ncbi:hypothetical protein GORHZ_151_00290 [Gordonia rhizosphera NBRC 16068]|uniref:Uncharacterized protein n=1 Tax=Gordonia rhizosphera NBRC 16068 TaxID=1108045 RepID=K6WI91_9ACTN|nr:hypothetical protein GORHZ_151_00290 [Gordonia rhizosphera NBRC 16068]
MLDPASGPITIQTVTKHGGLNTVSEDPFTVWFSRTEYTKTPHGYRGTTYGYGGVPFGHTILTKVR